MSFRAFIASSKLNTINKGVLVREDLRDSRTAKLASVLVIELLD